MLKWLAPRKKRKFHQLECPPDDYSAGNNAENDFFNNFLNEAGNDAENDVHIDRPIYSKKDYRSVVLSNGLAVLLISDVSASTSSAAMTVQFGSFNDPPDMLGLAHLMEHMLFLGTSENDFRSFVQRNGGRPLAVTDFEHTGYSFNIHTALFEASLQRFANMFISPRMVAKDLKSEIKTINQEFEIWKFRDVSRFWRLFAYTTHAHHLFHRFTHGNKSSLSKHSPKTICDTAMKLFGRHFVAPCMKLVIVGEGPVDKLEELARKYFSNIKSDPPPIRSLNYDENNWKNCLWTYGVANILESLEGLQRMRISWILPAVSQTHEEKRPEMFIYRLLSDECPGSLYYFLKSKLWITSFVVFAGFQAAFSVDDNSSYMSTVAGQLFLIDIDITDRGWEHKYDIVSYVYQYLNHLKTTDLSQSLSSLNEEFTSLMNMQFQCLDSDNVQLCDPVKFSLALAVNMLKCPVSRAISFDFFYEFGDSEAIKEMLREFTTKNMKIDILSKPFTEKGVIEPYFSAKYKEESIQPSYLLEWESPKEMDPALHLPQTNDWMPTTTHFWEVPDDGMECDYQAIADNCYFKDSKSKLSEASLKIYLNLGRGVFPHTLARVYLEIIKDDLSSLLFKAQEGYISTEIALTDDNSIQLELYGCHENFKALLASIWERYQTFEPTEDHFEFITEKMKRDFYGESHDLVHHASWLLTEAVMVAPFTMEDKFIALRLITFDNLISHLPFLRSGPQVVAVFSGSLSREECKQIYNLFAPFGDFKIRRYFEGKRELLQTQQVFALPLTKSESNCLAKVYYQMACDEKSGDRYAENVTVFLHLLRALLHEKVICDLRMKQRLGYLVGCDISIIHETIGFSFFIVSPDYKRDPLLKKIYAFVGKIDRFLKAIDLETFKSVKSRVTFPDRSGMSDELIHGDSDINGFHSMAPSLLESMDKEAVIELFDHFFVQSPSIIELCLGGATD